MKILLLLGLLLTVLGCAPTPQKTQPSASISALEAARVGIESYQEWEREKHVPALDVARENLAIALQAAPDNAQLQIIYYQTLYSLASLDWQPWHDELEHHFASLQPIVRQSLTPPAYLHYATVESSASLDQAIALLTQAVEQQPRSPDAWYFLSLNYEAKGYQQYGYAELALHAAKTAYQINDIHPALISQVGSSYQLLSYTQDCLYRTPYYARTAIKYLSSAVSKDQGNSRLRERLATLYAQVGLFPLALQEAQKAYELENNEATRDTLAKANYDMGRMQQASDLLQGPAAVTTTQNSSQLLALIAAHKGAWAEAKTQYENSYQKATPSIYNYIIQQWLLAINNEPYAAPANWQVDTNSEWEASLLEYFTTDTLSAEQLLARAGTSCQQTEAHFSVALSAWINADSSTARAQLEKIIALKNYSYSEYLWAKALLSADVVGE